MEEWNSRNHCFKLWVAGLVNKGCNVPDWKWGRSWNYDFPNLKVLDPPLKWDNFAMERWNSGRMKKTSDRLSVISKQEKDQGTRKKDW